VTRLGQDDDYAAFVRENRGWLVSTALTLTSGDAHLAEDLVQNALVRVYLKWSRIRSGRPAAYARKALVSCFIDDRRRPSVRREEAVEMPPERTAVVAGDGELDPELVAALVALGPRMRAAVVLRHVYDLSVDEVAEALGCSTGNVKSQTARGLTRLRELLASEPSTMTGEAR
jgi:RNA polymerase sigma-70 factor (sigma-E family)